MSIATAGTFDYVGIVPTGGAQNGGTWQLRDQSGAALVETGDPLSDSRLLGLEPTLAISGTRLMLTASGPHRAGCAAASFFLDPAVIDVFQGGDVLSLTRTYTAEVGVSLVRADELVVALGAATQVPIGSDVGLGGEWLGPGDTGWMDVVVGGSTAQLRPGERATVGDLEITVLSCRKAGSPGNYECLAISRIGACSHDAAVRSAQRLGLAIRRW
jgi:hypothetical protein